jgi:hypothetical protein
MDDNFTLRYVLKHPGVNSWAELVPSPRAYIRPKRRFAPLARGLLMQSRAISVYAVIFSLLRWLPTVLV